MHTKEPWEVYVDPFHAWLLDKTGSIVAKASPDSEDLFSRIVACVNACAGIETEALEEIGTGGLLKTLNEAIERVARLE